MQAIARVNRVFRDKPGGLVVDYIGIANELKEALREYTQSQGQGRPTVPAEEAVLKLEEYMEIIRGMLHGVRYDAFRSNALPLIRMAANHILGLPEGKKRFADAVLAATQAFALCCTLDRALECRDELAFFQATRAVLTKGDPGSRIDDQAREHALRLISLLRYRNRAIETAQVIEELIAMAKQFREAAGRGDKLGLSADELAFYDALAANESSVRELGDETLRKIARELTDRLRKSNKVDWYLRESVRASLRLMVRTILKKYKYPPDRQEEATETVLKQAEMFSMAWAATG